MRFKVSVKIEEQFRVYVEAEDFEDAEDKVNSALAKMSIQQMVAATNVKTSGKYSMADEATRNSAELPEGIEEAEAMDDYDGGLIVGEAEEDE